tara:strand:- start:440 stop:1396 length:957 start_codon:yes stop_codon:yes gene_type:complete
MMSKISEGLKKYKNAATSEAKETRLLVKILMSAAKEYKKDRKFKLDTEEVQFIKDQSQDILKLIPLIVLQILPGSMVATPFIIELSNKLGIKLNSKIPKKHQEEKNDGEISELVNADGSMVGKSTPILQLDMHPRKTMDQTVVATRQTNNPMVRGYRVYYGESEEKDDEKMLDEVDYSDAFGYDETENVSTYDDADEVLADLGIEDPFERNERLEVLGFDPQLDKQLKQEKKRGQCKNCFTKRRLSELENQKMVKMIDEILLDKKHNSKDVLVKSKDDDEEKSPISKILMRNIESIKKIAEREGLSLNKLIKHFKESE